MLSPHLGLFLHVLNIRLFFRPNGLDDSGDNMREDRSENRYDDCQYDDNPPQAKDIRRGETVTLDHLKDPDQKEAQNQTEIYERYSNIFFLKRHMFLVLSVEFYL